MELLALLLRGDKPMQRAATLVHGVGGLLALERAAVQAIVRAGGVGQADAAAVAAALELGRRMAALPVPYARLIEAPNDLDMFLRMTIGQERQERFVVLGLDAHRRLQIVRTIAIGTPCRVNVHPREVFRPLVEAGIESVIFAHNHPNGTVEFSDEDIAFTEHMASVGVMLGICVLDHIVVARDRWSSMADIGLLDRLPSHA